MAASLSLGAFGVGAGTAWAAAGGNGHGANGGGNGNAVAGANNHGNGNGNGNVNAGAGAANANPNSNAGGGGNGNKAGSNGNANTNSNAGGNKSNGNAGGAGNGNAGGNGNGKGNAGAAPPGNNGTIKIDEYSMDPGQDNDPHVSCPFSISFFGYDSGTQTANITISAVAPTRGGTAYTATTGWTTPQRTSGSQFDANYQVDGAALMKDLSGVTPQAKQGYHLRVEVEVTGSQGSDDKYKVLWMQPCAPAVTGTTPPPGGGTPPPGGVTPPPGGVLNSGGGNLVPPAVAAGHSPAIVAPAGSVATPAASSALANVPAGAAAAAAAGHSASVPTSGGARTAGVLAFTGASVGGLVALGLGLIAGGLLLLRRSRRSATSSI